MVTETVILWKRETVNYLDLGNISLESGNYLQVLRPLSPPNSADESSVSQWNVIKHVLIGTHKVR